MKTFKRLYFGDAVICVILAALLLLSAILIPRLSASGGSDSVRVLLDGKELAVLPLSRDVQCFSAGTVLIRIEGGRAYIYESDCPDGICKRMSGVDKDGGGAVCVPNRVVLEPYGEHNNHYIIG